ncbi:hypothetical protein ABT288_23535 [Streptomyces sp. NPDC001093]|uniref:hypothetical protein n=1 Tax=Streptomyces sp. NPDC001093 TaxID=3154376 RepID=UPI00333086BD
MDLLYPSSSQATTSRRRDTGHLTVTLPTAPSAVLLRLSRLNAPSPDETSG